MEELPELTERGVNEEVIRSVAATVFLGEHYRRITAEDIQRDHRDCRWRRHGERHLGDQKFLTNSRIKTASVIQTFLLAATTHPEVVRLAQQELDEVLGGERLPNFSDKFRLPYISAILKETLRWMPPNPLGTIHVCPFR